MMVVVLIVVALADGAAVGVGLVVVCHHDAR